MPAMSMTLSVQAPTLRASIVYLYVFSVYYTFYFIIR